MTRRERILSAAYAVSLLAEVVVMYPVQRIAGLGRAWIRLRAPRPE